MKGYRSGKPIGGDVGEYAPLKPVLISPGSVRGFRVFTKSVISLEDETYIECWVSFFDSQHFASIAWLKESFCFDDYAIR